MAIVIWSASDGNENTSIWFHMNTNFTGIFPTCIPQRTEDEKVLACAVHSVHCVSVCEGHSTVLYIKLSAPQLSSSGKWSLTARGGVGLPTLNLKQRMSRAPGHCFSESPNTEEKILFVCVCDACACFFVSCTSLWTLCPAFTRLLCVCVCV